jgi:hypothetical protein
VTYYLSYHPIYLQVSTDLFPASTSVLISPFSLYHFSLAWDCVETNIVPFLPVFGKNREEWYNVGFYAVPRTRLCLHHTSRKSAHEYRHTNASRQHHRHTLPEVICWPGVICPSSVFVLFYFNSSPLPLQTRAALA